MIKSEINGGELCEYEAQEVPINEVKKMIFKGTWKGSLEEEEVLYNLQNNLYSEEYKSQIVRLLKLNDDAEKWVMDNLETNALSFEETQMRKLAYFAGAETTRIDLESEKKHRTDRKVRNITSM